MAKNKYKKGQMGPKDSKDLKIQRALMQSKNVTIQARAEEAAARIFERVRKGESQ